MKIFVLFFFLILSVFAVEIESGKEYNGPVSLEVSSEGLSFKLAPSWKAMLNENASLSASKNGGEILSLISIFPLRHNTVIQEMSQVQDMGDGIFLHPINKPIQVSKSLYQGDYKLSGTQKPMKARILVVLFSSNKALVLIGASSTAYLKQMHKDLKEMALSTKYSKPKQGKNTNEWYKKLVGQHLVKYYTGSGYTEKQEWWLCSDGHFETSFNASSASSLGTGAASGGNIGEWKVSANTLILNFKNGSSSHYQLSMYNGLIHINNEKVLRDANNYCR